MNACYNWWSHLLLCRQYMYPEYIIVVALEDRNNQIWIVFYTCRIQQVLTTWNTFQEEQSSFSSCHIVLHGDTDIRDTQFKQIEVFCFQVPQIVTFCMLACILVQTQWRLNRSNFLCFTGYSVLTIAQQMDLRRHPCFWHLKTEHLSSQILILFVPYHLATAYCHVIAY